MGVNVTLEAHGGFQLGSMSRLHFICTSPSLSGAAPPHPGSQLGALSMTAADSARPRTP